MKTLISLANQATSGLLSSVRRNGTRRAALTLATLAFGSSALLANNTMIYFPMTVENGSITETISGKKVPIEGRFAPMSIKGIDGKAWRTDGYSSCATADLGSVFEGTQMTATLRIAIDTYPIIHHERYTEDQIPVVSCLNDDEKTGFGFYLGRTGKYSFRIYADSELVEVNAADILPLWQWNTLVAVVDSNVVKLYCDGVLVGSSDCSPGFIVKGPFHIAWDKQGERLGDAPLGAFNGAIDHFRVTNTVDVVSDYKGGYADLNFSTTRYANDIMRPHFHAMPMMNWTNETHGLIKYNGKYHIFFQKTGSAPIMSHQHWGHIVSSDLIKWKDDTPALAPGVDYDIKGCWSGCVFTDPDFNEGRPTILYTGVNYAEPFAAGAFSTDDNLRTWVKDTENPYASIEQTNGKHFRDTYFFRDGEQKYFIVGSKVDDQATTFLFKYEDGKWVPDGNFFKSTNRETDGTFAEMPNVVKFGDRWMMTTTPTETAKGVTCNYRTGRIENGHFIPDPLFENPKQVDILGSNGFGLMSPSPYTDENGKVIALGIVADKLPTHYNLEMGYAHLYSLPREWSLDEDGDLLQKPFSGLEALRTEDEDRQFHETDVTLDGVLNLAPVRGREIEAIAKFEVGDAPFGFHFYKDIDGNCASVTYNPENHELSVDFGAVDRYDQDAGNPNRFSAILEKVPAKGEEMKIHLFIDHSIIDIFVNDRYASSVRIFPRDIDASVIDVFANGETHLISVDAYIMNENPEDDPEIIYPIEPETPESTGKVAMLVGYANDQELQNGSEDEKEAVKFFTQEFAEGQVLYADDLDKVDARLFDCIWIHIDRDGIDRGWQNLPAPFNSQSTLDIINQYVSDGGNLYLSTHATQLVEAIGRTYHGITEFSSGDGGVGNDVWQVNISAHNQLHLNHPIYYGIPTQTADYGVLIDLLGNPEGLHRQDHNCLWSLERCNGHDSFSANHNARVLGTWGHNGGQMYAGIVEFLPEKKVATKAIDQEKIENRKGTIIANGLAACEWACKNGGINQHQANLESLTRNTLAYLSPKVVEQEDDNTGVLVIGETESETTPTYYSLQGLKIKNPTPGNIYIRVTGSRSEKIIIR